jgi:hypothetical protein
MVLIQAAVVVIGLGFAITLIGSIKARAWNAAFGTHVRYVDLMVPFVQRWAPYSGAVGAALLLSYGLASLQV